jgi:hypothetical protein
MRRSPPIHITDDLILSIDGGMVRLTPSEGLRAAERIARASFRRALAEEVTTAAPGFGGVFGTGFTGEVPRRAGGDVP